MRLQTSVLKSSFVQALSACSVRIRRAESVTAVLAFEKYERRLQDRERQSQNGTATKPNSDGGTVLLPDKRRAKRTAPTGETRLKTYSNMHDKRLDGLTVSNTGHSKRPCRSCLNVDPGAVLTDRSVKA
jgi:hypothetical protein